MYISILENKKLVFQRVTPYGYGATITAVIDHPVLGIDDEEKALDFLLDNNVIYNRPPIPEMGNQEEMKRQQALAEEAYEDLSLIHIMHRIQETCSRSCFKKELRHGKL